MGIADVARLLGRSVARVRIYLRSEGLPHTRDPKSGRLIFDEAAVKAWAARPEVADFLKWGDRRKYGRPQASRAAD